MPRNSSAATRIVPLFLCAAVVIGLAGFASSGACRNADLFANEAEWKLSVNSTVVQTAIVPFGSDFVFESRDAYAAGSAELLAALDGVRLSLPQPPAISGKITVQVTLNVQGNSFRTAACACIYNMTVAVFIGGRPVEDIPLAMTIPSETRSYLLNGDYPRGDIAFAYAEDGAILNDNIETTDLVQSIMVRFVASSTIIGGNRSDLGIPASVGYSNWYKIKKLFE